MWLSSQKYNFPPIAQRVIVVYLEEWGLGWILTGGPGGDDDVIGGFHSGLGRGLHAFGGDLLANGANFDVWAEHESDVSFNHFQHAKRLVGTLLVPSGFKSLCSKVQHLSDNRLNQKQNDCEYYQCIWKLFFLWMETSGLNIVTALYCKALQSSWFKTIIMYQNFWSIFSAIWKWWFVVEKSWKT